MALVVAMPLPVTQVTDTAASPIARPVAAVPVMVSGAATIVGASGESAPPPPQPLRAKAMATTHVAQFKEILMFLPLCLGYYGVGGTPTWSLQWPQCSC